MLDLYLAILGMVSLAIGLGWSFHLAVRGYGRNVRLILCFIAALWITASVRWYFDPISAARYFPFTTTVIFANTGILAVGMLAGVAWSTIQAAAWRKCLGLGVLAILCFWQSFGMVFQRPPATKDWWLRGNCLQTSQSTCSAAAAATLLGLHGIPATEKEMAELCLTRDKGTSMLGLYRGLKIKTEGTDYDVMVVTGSATELREIAVPVLITVGIEYDQEVDPRYTRMWGWPRGQMHSVVLFGWRPNGRAAIADPSVGWEQWTQQVVSDLYRGTGFCLVPKKG